MPYCTQKSGLLCVPKHRTDHLMTSRSVLIIMSNQPAYVRIHVLVRASQPSQSSTLSHSGTCSSFRFAVAHMLLRRQPQKHDAVRLLQMRRSVPPERSPGVVLDTECRPAPVGA